MRADSFPSTPLRRIAVLLVVLALAACDNAGPEGGDTTPPSASAANSNGSNVTITFNEAIDPASASADAFSITPGSVGIASASASGSTVTLVLAAGLSDSPRRSYTVSFSGIRDAAGNAVSNGSVSFDYGTDAPPVAALRIDFSRIEAVKDCDGIEGDGDFAFDVTVETSTGQTHTAFDGSATMGEGGVFSTLTDVRFEFSPTDGHQVDVTFRATELDQDIFGNTYPDDRMDDLAATGTHRFNSGAWSNPGAVTLTNGSGDCEVRLYYAALPG